jgi:hypothetical protein
MLGSSQKRTPNIDKATSKEQTMTVHVTAR